MLPGAWELPKPLRVSRWIPWLSLVAIGINGGRKQSIRHQAPELVRVMEMSPTKYCVL